jgi:hypothetical protein
MKKNIRPELALAFLLGMILSPVDARAAHPIITDDTGTQGKGKTQIEVNGEYGWDRETAEGIEAKGKAVALETVLSYGVMDSLDLVLTLPYARVQETVGGVTTRQNGVNDVSTELKWMFWERTGTSLAIKPGVSFPTGNEEKGLGTGKYGVSAFLVGTQEIEHWTFHVNLGYLRNNNRFEEEENLWHASLASEWKASEAVKLVANIGMEKNADPAAEKDPSFALVGFIYSLSEGLDIDFGYKAGLNDPETDQTILAGMAWRF